MAALTDQPPNPTSGWADPGTPSNAAQWRFSVDKGWIPPGGKARTRGTQLHMPPSFDPRKRGQGYNLVASPPGAPAPIDQVNYTPATKSLSMPGEQAPLDQTNLTPMPVGQTPAPVAPEILGEVGSDMMELPVDQILESISQSLLARVGPLVGMQAAQEQGAAVGVGADDDPTSGLDPNTRRQLEASGRLPSSQTGRTYTGERPSISPERIAAATGNTSASVVDERADAHNANAAAASAAPVVPPTTAGAPAASGSAIPTWPGTEATQAFNPITGQPLFDPDGKPTMTPAIPGKPRYMETEEGRIYLHPTTGQPISLATYNGYLGIKEGGGGGGAGAGPKATQLVQTKHGYMVFDPYSSTLSPLYDEPQDVTHQVLPNGAIVRVDPNNEGKPEFVGWIPTPEKGKQYEALDHELLEVDPNTGDTRSVYKSMEPRAVGDSLYTPDPDTFVEGSPYNSSAALESRGLRPEYGRTPNYDWNAPVGAGSDTRPGRAGWDPLHPDWDDANIENEFREPGQPVPPYPPRVPRSMGTPEEMDAEGSESNRMPRSQFESEAHRLLTPLWAFAEDFGPDRGPNPSTAKNRTWESDADRDFNPESQRDPSQMRRVTPSGESDAQVHRRFGDPITAGNTKVPTGDERDFGGPAVRSVRPRTEGGWGTAVPTPLAPQAGWDPNQVVRLPEEARPQQGRDVRVDPGRRTPMAEDDPLAQILQAHPEMLVDPAKAGPQAQQQPVDDNIFERLLKRFFGGSKTDADRQEPTILSQPVHDPQLDQPREGYKVPRQGPTTLLQPVHTPMGPSVLSQPVQTPGIEAPGPGTGRTVSEFPGGNDAFRRYLASQGVDVGTGQDAMGAGTAQGWQPPVDPKQVVGTGNKFGQPVDLEGIHKGLDLQAYQGTPALAPVDGVVTSVEDDPKGLGIQVVVRGANGEEHRLSHLEGTDVKVGDQVRAGQPVGKVGSTGASTGPHLDYRINEPDGSFANPEDRLGTLSQMPDASGVGAGEDEFDPDAAISPELDPGPEPEPDSFDPIVEPVEPPAAPWAAPNTEGWTPWGPDENWLADPYTSGSFFNSQSGEWGDDKSAWDSMYGISPAGPAKPAAKPKSSGTVQLTPYQRAALDQAYKTKMAELDQAWKIHQDDEKYNRDKMALDSQMQLFMSALRNPWLQQLTGRAPAWNAPGGPGATGAAVAAGVGGGQSRRRIGRGEDDEEWGGGDWGEGDDSGDAGPSNDYSEGPVSEGDDGWSAPDTSGWTPWGDDPNWSADPGTPGSFFNNQTGEWSQDDASWQGVFDAPASAPEQVEGWTPQPTTSEWGSYGKYRPMTMDELARQEQALQAVISANPNGTAARGARNGDRGQTQLWQTDVMPTPENNWNGWGEPPNGSPIPNWGMGAPPAESAEAWDRQRAEAQFRAEYYTANRNATEAEIDAYAAARIAAGDRPAPYTGGSRTQGEMSLGSIAPAQVWDRPLGPTAQPAPAPQAPRSSTAPRAATSANQSPSAATSGAPVQSGAIYQTKNGVRTVAQMRQELVNAGWGGGPDSAVPGVYASTTGGPVTAQNAAGGTGGIDVSKWIDPTTGKVTNPSWEDWSAMTPFQRAAFRTQVELTGMPWEQQLQSMRQLWGGTGTTAAPSMTSLGWAVQSPLDRVGFGQIAESFGQTADDRLWDLQRGWAPARAASVASRT